MTATLSGEDLGLPIESTEPVTIDQSWLANQQREEWGYCTEFIVLDPLISSDEMRAAMAAFGESESIVSGEGMIRVHIHTASPEEALGHAETAGSSFGIDNGQFRIKAILDFSKMASQCPSTRLAEYITDKQNFHALI